MSTPKKPGTDLAALKARLAKKTAGVSEDVPPPGQAAQAVPPPGHVAPPMPEVPAPGQYQAPMADVPPPGGYAPEPMHDVPPPGGYAPEPMADVPPPGGYAPEPMQPQMQQPQAPRMQQPSYGGDGSYGAGSSMGGFDPDAGVIDGGPEIKPRGNKGLILLAALAAAGLGVAVGWLGHTITSKKALIAQGHAKGEKMVAQVLAVSEARKSVSLAMEDIKKEIAQDPAGSADKVTTLLTTSFDKQPQLSEMFGWQLASVDPAGIKATFQLYQQLAGLQENLSLMAKILGGYGNFIKVGGPSLYGVTFSPSGVQMVGIADTLCGELPAEGAAPAEGAPPTLKSCGADSAKAVAYRVVDPGGGPPKDMPRGTGEGMVQVLLAEGPVYDYAIGIEQKNNATNFYKMALSRVEESLVEMNGAEEKALASLKRYSEDPNVDGSQSADGG